MGNQDTCLEEIVAKPHFAHSFTVTFVLISHDALASAKRSITTILGMYACLDLAQNVNKVKRN